MSLTYGSLAHDLMFQNGFEGKTCPIVSILTPGSFINEMSHCHRDHHHHYSQLYYILKGRSHQGGQGAGGHAPPP